MKKIYMLITVLLVAISLQGQDADVVQAASNFLKTLGPGLREKTIYPFADNERFNWHFVPRRRNGPTFQDFNTLQRDALLALLKASLSDQGFKKTTDIFKLEKILQGVEGRSDNDSYRDPLNYHITLFGTPAADKPWGWRLEGHHISLNFASGNGKLVSSTPSFFGANPAVVPSGKDKGWQVLKMETELGFALVNALTKEQLATALIGTEAFADILSSNKRKAGNLEPKGIAFSKLNDAQQKIFLQLLDVYVRNYQLGFSNTLMEKIKNAGIDNLWFAWAGSLKQGDGHYYRIQGPMLLIEYDNTQNNANHVHSVVRDLTNDFAEDILREHYVKEHSTQN
jgi:hypothetical protein